MAAAGERRGSTGSDMMKEDRAGTARSHFDVRNFMPERVGVEISKRYDLDREVGAGGYGKVFLAKDKKMQNRTVAIKKVIVFDSEKKKAFSREVSIMKKLDHPNICKLLETYEQGKFMYFVMELCSGGEVFDRIMNQGQVDEKTTADIIRQVASALRYAHNNGIAHRDLKPENICFANKDVKENFVKVIDWGLGFYFGQSRMRSAVGSLTYAAPEVLETKELDGYTSACDLWSLGVVAYVMLCGKPPFWGNYQEQLKRMKQEKYPMEDKTWKGISKDAKDLIRALLKASPKQRLELDKVLAHPWLKNPASTTDPAVGREVLTNLKQFSNTSQFFSLCVASVARQLDHKSLRDVHKVFSDMDTNNDGVLELSEVRAGFEKIFGKNSEQYRDVDAMFARLDLDGSGSIDYTEFCAAGMGERLTTDEDTLWAAFKAFDVNDDDGKISKDEIKKVLRKADKNNAWTDRICEELSSELFSRFDRDGDGNLDFDEWLSIMRELAARRQDGPERAIRTELAKQGAPRLGQLDAAYSLLQDIGSSVSPSRRASAGATGSNTTSCCAGICAVM